ncbi:MAG: hypothetical protein GC162_11700 [Planctomycetes bacterium]|nr:hypothetical protein [Planctomycetota bacterium]
MIPSPNADAPMSASAALRRAMLTWFVLVMIVACALSLTLVQLTAASTASGAEAGTQHVDGWFVLSMIMLGLLTPACIVSHWMLFRHYWKDGIVQPHGYLKASVVLWTGLSVACIVVCIGAVMRNVFMPDLLLAVPEFALLVLSWPNGWAMTHPVPREFEDDQEILHLQGV